MPIKKYKTFQEAREDLWNFNPDEEWLKKAFRIFDFPEVFGKLKTQRPFEQGIKKFKTFEEFLEYKNSKLL
jgi:hypothetical protein